jgi:hypothetical protein
LLVNDWNKDELDIFRINFSLLILIPKEADVVPIQKFRPIALTNCTFKIFSKCATNRLGLVSEELISQNHAAFIKRRYKIIHDVAHNSQSGFIFKLDYEKAYDKVNREFMFKMLESRGFSPRWIKILKSLLDNWSVRVRINDENSDFFLTRKGVRQRDPISPILFNFVADVSTRMLLKAATHGHITDLMQSMTNTRVISMQYADNTLLFLKNDLHSAINLKWLLSCFEQMSEMIINFHKCDLISIKVEEQDAHLVSQSLCCKLGKFPLKYLGVPLHYTKLRKEDIQPIVDKLPKKAAGWRGRLLNHATKLELVRSVLASFLYTSSVLLNFPSGLLL